MNYALVEAGIVVNIIVLNEMNHEDFPDSIAILDLPVAIGDTYINGTFYRDNVEVVPLSQIEPQGLD